MAEQRALRRAGHSWVVAVPVRVRAHLKLKVPGAAYWHVAGPGEAVVSAHSTRTGGKPAGLDLAPQLVAAEREIARLRGRVADRPRAVYNEGVNAGVGMAQRLGYAFEEKLSHLTAAVLRIERQVGGAPPVRVPRRRRAAASPSPPAAPPAPTAAG